MKNQQKRNGITLIALVITIVVLLILASTSIGMLIGDDGILNNTKKAKEETIKQTATEKINLKITNSQMKSYAKEQRMPTLQEVADDLCEDNEMEYVLLESKKSASLDKITVGEENSIFTKIKEYPYEFEINSSLQLASIDGVKIADTNTITVPKEEYETLKGTVEELSTVHHYDKNSFQINTSYIDSGESTINVTQVGKVVTVSLKLIFITDVPNSGPLLVSALPIPENDFLLFIGRKSNAGKVELKMNIKGELILYWPNIEIKSGENIEASITYICK